MKTITSKIKEFPGTVDLISPVPYPVFIEWEKAVSRAEEDTQGEKELALWAGVKAMSEKWDIKGFDLDNPVASPRKPVMELLTWIIKEVGLVINEVTDPN